MREGKYFPINACFLPFTPFYFPKSYFTLSHFSLLSFSTLYLDCLSHCPPSSYGYCSYLYTKSSLCDFSLLPLWLINHFVCCNHSSEMPTTFLVVLGFNLHYLWACTMFFLSTSSYPMTNSLPFHFAMYLSHPFEWYNLRSLFTNLSRMH